MNYMEMLVLALNAALDAGKSIRMVYDGNMEIEEKADGSPLTLADRLANGIICKQLETTGIPIISEENKAINYDQRKAWSQFWLVDPLDGTKEFISRNGEFTVNIALIRDGEPVLGVLTAPALHQAWFAAEGMAAHKMHDTRLFEENDKALITAENTLTHSSKLSASKPGKQKEVTVSVSRSHLDDKTRALVRKMSEHDPNVKMFPKGSSIKFCDLAEGKSLFYPRFTPCYEWDTAAGHAILKASGGEIINLESKEALRYNKPELKSPPFVAFRAKEDSEPFMAKFSL